MGECFLLKNDRAVDSNEHIHKIQGVKIGYIRIRLKVLHETCTGINSAIKKRHIFLGNWEIVTLIIVGFRKKQS